MTEFSFITASDIHVSDNGPRSRTDDFCSTVLGKIAQIRIACTKLSVDGFLLAGDLYNLKNPAKNSHRLNQRLIKEFGQFPCPIYMIEGNHDLTANRLESLDDQPLGVLFADKTLIQLRDEVIEKDGYKVSVVGVPYIEGLDLETVKIPKKGDAIFQIGLMHLYASPKGGMLFKEKIYGYDDMARLSPDLFVIGHYHVDQGIVECSGKKFVNLGAITRGTKSDEDLAHQPQIGYIKFCIEDGQISCDARSIKLRAKPVSEVFDLTKREEEQKENLEIEMFVEKLSAETAEKAEVSDEGMEDLLGSMDMPKIVKERVMHFIQEAVAEEARKK